jgi:serine phosphatase RsbU (regulator of sigma subunit)
VLVASRRHTDLYEWAQRDTPFSLAAEIQRRLLPPAYTIEAGSFTLAGWLEPAATVGGDTFDYSLDREYLYASITDAMGHFTEAAMLATLTVGSLRNSRRSLATPVEQAVAANAALFEHASDDQFVTGILIRLCLSNGMLEVVNAGHPVPCHLRAGVSAELEIPPDPAFGMTDPDYHAHVVQLEPGDRLVFVTDGFLERNAVDVDLGVALEASRERHPREVVRELAANVLRATDGNLRDDATVLCLDWHGANEERTAEGGASTDRATHQ